jgi:hypothetical protein
VNPNQYPINGSGAASNISTQNWAETFSNGILGVVTTRVRNCEIWMPIDGINNKPTAIVGIGVTDAKGSHDVIYQTPSKPTYSRCKANFW